MYPRFHEVKLPQDTEMIQSGGRDGSRSGTPVAMNLEGRVMFSNQSSLPLPSIINSNTSYPSISSPSPQISHSIFAGSKYLPSSSSSTPPEAHSRYISEGYRISPPEQVADDLRFGVDSHRLISSELYKQPSQHLQQHLIDQSRTNSEARRIREDQIQVPEYHRSTEDLYQNNNPIDLQQRVSSNGIQQMSGAQKLGSEILRLHGESQRLDEIRAEQQQQQLLRIDPSVTASSSVITGISVSPVNNSPINYRQVMSNTHRYVAESQLSPRVSHESSFRTHTDSQRLVQESFREFLTTSQRHYIDDPRPGPAEYQRHSNTNSENMRYLPSLNIQSPRSLIASNSRMGDDELPTSHIALPENIRVLNSIDGNRPLVAENLRIEENQSVIQDNMRLETDTPQSMVPENLCLTETSHSQVLPENLQSRHEPAGRLELTDNNGRIIANSRILNHLPDHSHIPSSESPIAMIRSHYGSINSNPTTPPHRMIASDSQPLRVQSPHYSENMYRTDIHNNIGTPAPPTPAPSVPPMPDQASTPLPPQYYAYSHSSHTNHSNSFPAYVNENFDDGDNLTLEEKIERGYQDIKPFDQDYPVSVPMMHVPQDNLPPPPPQVPKPAKPPKKAKEPKPPRMPIVHKCNDCLRVFKNSTQLKNHMWRHTGEKPFTCDECGSKFTQQGNLRAHRRIHTGERPYHCTDCKACFTQLSTLKTHQKIHSDERPYKCNECDAAFRQIANLKTHQVTHTGERPHKCDLCDKAFTQKSNLKAHKNRVHIGGEGVAVPAKRGRKKNLVAIKPFNCLECGAKFTVLSNLKIHAKLHSGNRPFECDHCGAGFAQRSNLKTHIQRMHGKSPGQPRRRIRCDECPAMFRLRRCLKTHKKRRHPIKSLKIKILRESNHLNSAVVEGGGGTEEIVEGEEDDDCDDDDDDGDEEDEGDEEEDEEEDDEGMEEEDEITNQISKLSTHLTSGNVYENVFNDNDGTGVSSLEGYSHLSKEGHTTDDFRSLKKESLRDSYNPNDIVAVSMVEPIIEPKIEIIHQSSPAPMFNNEMDHQHYIGSAENSHDNSATSPTLDSVSAKMTCIGNVDNIIVTPVPTYQDGQHSHNNISIHNHLGSTEDIPTYSAEQIPQPSCDFSLRTSRSS